MTIITDLIKYSRLAFSLRDILKDSPISLEQSKEVIATRFYNRKKNFLSLIEKGVYQNPRSPFFKLLKVADCEFGDIESMVNQDGIEAALSRLLAEGIYISWEEFKGKKDVVRGGSHFRFSERDFDNPYLPDYYQIQSSGSRSAGTRTIFDLRYQMEKGYYLLPMLAANNALDFPIGLWSSIPPSGTGIGSSLRYWKVGKPVAKWFSPVGESQMHISMRDRLALRYIIYGSRLWGAKLVKPKYVSSTEAVKVAQWMAITKRQFGGCSIQCPVSLSVKVCQAAMENSLDIQGTHFFSGGEPLTEAKRCQIEATGALVRSIYSISEIGRIGYGCPESSITDDLHLFHDSVALVQRRRKLDDTDMFVNAFCFTTLLPTAPKILINVESDDYGVMETRDCGCLFEQLGFVKHLYNIRSFAKLTGAGVTILGTDFVRILEEVLPGKYGGVATDYQLLEEEDGIGQTHLSLIISPTVGMVDENAVIATILDELGRSTPSNKVATRLWSQMKILKVKRIHPVAKTHKVMTLHLMKRND